MVRFRRTLVLGVAAFAACHDDPTGPVAGSRWVLDTLDGVAMPVTLYARPEASGSVLADTIYLMLNGRSRWVRYTRTTRPLLEPPIDVTARTEGLRRYKVRGDSIFFPYECPDVADCLIGPYRGRLTSDRNSMTLIGDASVREYRRVLD